jgi:hypothetical protein
MSAGSDRGMETRGVTRPMARQEGLRRGSADLRNLAQRTCFAPPRLRVSPPLALPSVVTPDALNAELSRDPFIPLRLFLTDGRTLLIPNPGLCFINQGALYVARPAEQPARRRSRRVSLRHVVSIEQAPEPGAGSANGM